MSKATKRKRRCTRIEAYNVRYESGCIVFSEWRGGTEHVVRVGLGDDTVYRAERVHEACVEHAKNVRAARAAAWASANNACKRMGVTE